MPSGSASRPTRMPCRLPSAARGGGGGAAGGGVSLATRHAHAHRTPHGTHRLGGWASRAAGGRQAGRSLQPSERSTPHMLPRAAACGRTCATVGDVSPEVVHLNLPQPRKPLHTRRGSGGGGALKRVRRRRGGGKERGNLPHPAWPPCLPPAAERRARRAASARPQRAATCSTPISNSREWTP